jgi:sensor histidine kinase YesM
MLKQHYVYLAAFFVVLLISFQSGIADGKNEISFHLDSTVFYAINYFFWAFLISVINRIIHQKEPRFRSFVVIVAQSLLVLFFHFLVTNLLYFLAKQLYEPIELGNYISLTGNYLIESFFRRTVDLLLIVVILKAIENYRLSSERKEKLEVLNRQLQEKKFEVLKSQLNPHFLFNALHSVYTLIGYEDEKAKKMVMRISNLLRKMLDDSGNHFVPLSEELGFVNDYLAIEKERFHDRLTIELNIDEKSKPIEVPKLLLQPLVENAVKHGIASLEDGGTITISTKVHGDDVEISIINPVSDTSNKTESFGIGLSNLKQRLLTLDSRHSLETNLVDGEYVVSIILKDLAS